MPSEIAIALPIFGENEVGTDRQEFILALFRAIIHDHDCLKSRRGRHEEEDGKMGRPIDLESRFRNSTFADGPDAIHCSEYHTEIPEHEIDQNPPLCGALDNDKMQGSD
jgi:hypothetical protein